jgi:ankyrin repeat protein
MPRLSGRERLKIIRSLKQVRKLAHPKARETFQAFRRLAYKMVQSTRSSTRSHRKDGTVTYDKSELNGVLLQCCYYNNLAMARLTLALGADVNCCNRAQQTPLLLSPHFGSDALCAMLIHHGAAVGARAINGSTPLEAAIQSGRAKIVVRLIRFGADIHRPSVGGRSLAANSVGKMRILRALLDAGADPGIETSNAYFPLLYASQDGYIGAARLLLEYGADPNQKSLKSGATALTSAVRFGQLRFARFLLDRGADPHSRFYDGRSILEYAIDEDKAEVEEMIRAYL